MSATLILGVLALAELAVIVWLTRNQHREHESFHELLADLSREGADERRELLNRIARPEVTIPSPALARERTQAERDEQERRQRVREQLSKVGTVRVSDESSNRVS